MWVHVVMTIPVLRRVQSNSAKFGTDKPDVRMLPHDRASFPPLHFLRFLAFGDKIWEEIGPKPFLRMSKYLGNTTVNGLFCANISIFLVRTRVNCH